MARQRELPPEVPPEATGAPGGDNAPPPKFETPVTADAAAGIPRSIKGIERAPEGLARFKIRCLNVGESPTLYVLARTESQARKHYLETHGIPESFELDGKDVEPKLHITALAD